MSETDVSTLLVVDHFHNGSGYVVTFAVFVGFNVTARREYRNITAASLGRIARISGEGNPLTNYFSPGLMSCTFDFLNRPVSRAVAPVALPVSVSVEL